MDHVGGKIEWIAGFSCRQFLAFPTRLIRHFPDDLQVCGDHAPVPPSKELYPRRQPSDGLILEISPRLEDHLASFPAIQTHPSCRFHLTGDAPGLRVRLRSAGARR